MCKIGVTRLRDEYVRFCVENKYRKKSAKKALAHVPCMHTLRMFWMLWNVFLKDLDNASFCVENVSTPTP